MIKEKHINFFFMFIFTFLIDTSNAFSLEKPNLHDLADYHLEQDYITLNWSKINPESDSNTITIINYIISYTINETNNYTTNCGNPSKTDKPLETLSYTITNLQTANEYKLSIKAVTEDDESPWSNEVTCFLNFLPKFDLSFTKPEDGAFNVSKTPVISWKADDKDNDKLYYSFKYAESKDKLISTLGFSDSSSYTFTKQLKPNTTYYWQVWIREEDRYNDFYKNDEYPKSEFWTFTTENVGNDLAIIEVNQLSDIKPHSEAIFELKVKNLGTETAPCQYINSMYIKGDIESPFYIGECRTKDNLEPGETDIVNMRIVFYYDILEKNGKIFDNVLIAGESKVKFFFDPVNEQDIDSSNNQNTLNIYYNDINKPVIDYFRIKANGRDLTNSWALFGEPLQTVLKVADDLLISEIIVEFRFSQNSQWQIINQSDENHYIVNTSYSWSIPEKISPTEDAQIQVHIFDKQKNETIIQSEPFAIYSNFLNASILLEKNVYNVDEQIIYTITSQMANPLNHYEVKLLFNTDSETIHFQEQVFELGIWTISNNKYVSSNCYLELKVQDIYYNEFTIKSEIFTIKANKKMPYPFDMAQLYDEEFNFPENAANVNENRSIINMKLDENNNIHAFINHYYQYYENNIKHCYSDKIYIEYNPISKQRLSKIFLCDYNYEIVDFELISNSPHVLLKNNINKYFWTFKKNNVFFPLIPIVNDNVPNITDSKHLDICDSLKGISQCRYIYAMGYDTTASFYLWDLFIYNSKIKRIKYYDGFCQNTEEINVNNSIGKSLQSNLIKPASYLNMIYFIDPFESMLVLFNTQPDSLLVKGFNLPFSIEKEQRQNIEFRTAIAAYNDKVFVFGNGKVYELENNTLVEKNGISYKFNNDLVSYSNNWDDMIYKAETVVSENKIYLLLEVNEYSYPKPKRSYNELLEFNPETYTFNKNVVDFSNYFPIKNFTYLHKTNKVLFIQDTYTVNRCDFSSEYFLFDLDTGSYKPIGAINIENPFIISDPWVFDIYSISTSTLDSYQIYISNKQNDSKQIDSPQLVKNNDKLYVVWQYDTPYDGTWNYENNNINNRLKMKNIIMPLFPSKKASYEITNEYQKLSDFSVNSNIMSVPIEGAIYQLDSDMKIINSLNEKYYNCYLRFKSYDNTYAACLCIDQSRKKLFTNNMAEIIIQDSSHKPIIASFDKEVIIAGSYNDKFVISQINLSSGYFNKIFIDEKAWDSYNLIDINKNKFITICWDTFCGFADYSNMFLELDINHDQNIDISDAIFALKLCADIQSDSTKINENLYNVISILQYLTK